jgi:quinol monooxygenase YgiN
LVVAAVFEAQMSREQADRLAELMRDGRATRPEGVLTAALLVDGENVRLVAFWRDRETLDRYLAEAAVPRGTELMRKVGVEPELRIVEVLDLG